MQARFHAEPRVQAAELLLQERSPHLVPLDRPPEEHKVEETPGRAAAGARPAVRHAAHGDAARAPAVERFVQRDGHQLRAAATADGATSPSRAGARMRRATRGAASVTSGIWSRREFWSAGFHPSGREADSYEVTFAPDRAVLRRRDEEHRDIHRGHGVAGRRRRDSPGLADESLAGHPGARAHQLRGGRARAAGRRSGASRPSATCSSNRRVGARSTTAIICTRRPRSARARVSTWAMCSRAADASGIPSSSRPIASTSSAAAARVRRRRR